jgi:ppGpp synthetase/RelA/SpoT-type nucleotidyltranferase
MHLMHDIMYLEVEGTNKKIFGGIKMKLSEIKKMSVEAKKEYITEMIHNEIKDFDSIKKHITEKELKIYLNMHKEIWKEYGLGRMKNFYSGKWDINTIVQALEEITDYSLKFYINKKKEILRIA